jgi:hypothetical protein
VKDETHSGHPGDSSGVTTPTVAKKRKNNARKSIEVMFAMAVKHLEKDDDEFLIMAKGYAHKLQKMKPLQRLYADRLINEVLLEGQLENLNRNSSVTTDYTGMRSSASSSSNAWVPSYYTQTVTPPSPWCSDVTLALRQQKIPKQQKPAD